MVNFGNGFTWSEVYSMPIHWRRFYYNKLVESKKKEQKELKRSQGKSTPKGPGVNIRR